MLLGEYYKTYSVLCLMFEVVHNLHCKFNDYELPTPERMVTISLLQLATIGMAKFSQHGC